MNAAGRNPRGAPAHGDGSLLRDATVRGELGKLARIARKQKWRIYTGPGGHLLWYPPWPVDWPVRTPCTMGEGRAWQNTRQDLIRAGLVLRRGS